jgi:hypothetical protein
MTLQDWGAIDEVVGALAVVVTLIYLAKQIGQNTRAMEEARKLALRRPIKCGPMRCRPGWCRRPIRSSSDRSSSS